MPCNEFLVHFSSLEKRNFFLLTRVAFSAALLALFLSVGGPMGVAGLKWVNLRGTLNPPSPLSMGSGAAYLLAENQKRIADYIQAFSNVRWWYCPSLLLTSWKQTSRGRRWCPLWSDVVLVFEWRFVNPWPLARLKKCVYTLWPFLVFISLAQGQHIQPAVTLLLLDLFWLGFSSGPVLKFLLLWGETGWAEWPFASQRKEWATFQTRGEGGGSRQGKSLQGWSGLLGAPRKEEMLLFPILQILEKWLKASILWRSVPWLNLAELLWKKLCGSVACRKIETFSSLSLLQKFSMQVQPTQRGIEAETSMYKLASCLLGLPIAWENNRKESS